MSSYMTFWEKLPARNIEVDAPDIKETSKGIEYGEVFAHIVYHNVDRNHRWFRTIKAPAHLIDYTKLENDFYGIKS